MGGRSHRSRVSSLGRSRQGTGREDDVALGETFKPSEATKLFDAKFEAGGDEEALQASKLTVWVRSNCTGETQQSG